MRRFFVAVLTLCMFLPPAEAAEVLFSDVPFNSWYEVYVQQATKLGIVSGYKDSNGQPTGKFRPTHSVSLAEALKMSIEAANFSGRFVLHTCPKDCPLATGIDHWAAPYVQAAREAKFEVFASDVDLNRPASRRQMVQIIADAFSIATQPAPTVAPFTDVAINSKYAAAIANMKEFGILTGDMNYQGQPTGYFRPVDTINRAEALKMVMMTGDRFQTFPELAFSNLVNFNNGGVFPFTFKYPPDLVIKQTDAGGIAAEFELIGYLKSDPNTVLVTIRAYRPEAWEPDKWQSYNQPGFRVFTNNDYLVQIYTEGGIPNEAWVTITSSFAFLNLSQK